MKWKKHFNVIGNNQRWGEGRPSYEVTMCFIIAINSSVTFTFLAFGRCPYPE